ncbi:hypothetical protein JCM8097_007300 [Rhodosporidiobolus ruineniae]
MASQALTRSLSRSTSGRGLAAKADGTDSPQTVRPRRVASSSRTKPDGEKEKDEPTPRKKPGLPSLGRPAVPSSSTDSPSTARKPSATLRSTSSSSATPTTAQKTPLRTSARRPSTSTSSSAAAAPRQSGEMRPPPVPSTSSASSRTLHRRAPVPGASSIPVSAIPTSRTLRKAPSSASVASASSAVSGASEAESQQSAIVRAAEASALRRSRVGGLSGSIRSPAGKARVSTAAGAAASSRIPPRPRASQAQRGERREADKLAASTASTATRRDSWVTDPEPGSARPSLSHALEPLPSFALSPSGGEADRSWETVEGSRRSSALPFPSSGLEDSFATPRKPSPDGAGLPSRSAISYVSPDQSSLRHSLLLSPSSAASPPISALLSVSQSSHAAPLSPGSPFATPRPRQVSLLRQAGAGGRRNKPRDSASLEEILRLGLQSGTSGAQELELLLDEGSSVMMREDLEAAGLTGLDAGTPWRGRVLSLSVKSGPPSPGRRPVLLPAVEGEEDARDTDEERQPNEGVEEDDEGEEDDDEEATQVLVLPMRPTTNEAVLLRAELDTLRAELAAVQSQSADERVAQLVDALEEQRRRNGELEEQHREERDALEADLAELARAASSQPLPPPSQSSPASTSHLFGLSLDLAHAHAACALSLSGRSFEAVEHHARRERDEVKGSLEALRTVQVGLRGWEGLLGAVQAC